VLAGTDRAKSANLEVGTALQAREEGGWAVLTCDYNGWNDAPEEEREWFDQHPEIWGGLVRESDKRPYRVTPRRRPGR
jgi:hypothetical protein